MASWWSGEWMNELLGSVPARVAVQGQEHGTQRAVESAGASAQQ